MTQAQAALSTQVDFAGRTLSPRDIKRLSREPFQTKYPALEDQTVDALRGFKPPTHAYVLFERWRIELVGEDAEPIKNFGLFVFNVEHRPEQAHKIEFFVRKGYRILHWGNFHYLTDNDKESQKLAAMYDNAWAKLEGDLERFATTDSVRVENKQLLAENDALKAKVVEYERRLAQEKRAGKATSATPATPSASEEK